MPAGHEGCAEGACDLGIRRQEYGQSQLVAHELDDCTIHGHAASHGNGRHYSNAANHAGDTVYNGLAKTVQVLLTRTGAVARKAHSPSSSRGICRA
jgi:hypothetical protein